MRTGMWWKATLVAVVTVAGAFAALFCLVNYLLLGLAGSPVESGEQVLWPLGVLVSVTVPVLTGWWLLSRRLRWWVPVVLAAGLVAGTFALLAVLGS